MRYALVDANDVVVNVIELEEGAKYTPPDGLKLVAGRDWPAAPAPDPIPLLPRLIAKSVIVDRLQAAGKLTAARAALDAADLYTQERWNTRDAIYADDPSALGLLQAIGADPAVIMA